MSDGDVGSGDGVTHDNGDDTGASTPAPTNDTEMKESEPSPENETMTMDENSKFVGDQSNNTGDDGELGDGTPKKDEQDGETENEKGGDQAEESSAEKEEETSENPPKSSEPTDEFGRPLSAYEILRLERIKRNQAYLAKLGLEADAKTGKSKTLLGDEVPKKPKRKPKEKIEFHIQRRSRSARKTKSKEIDYTEKPVKQRADLLPGKSKQPKEKKEPKPKKPKSEKQQKREDRLPLFLYQEFRRIATTRNKNLRTAEKLNRAAENEVRMARRTVDNLARRYAKKKERESRSDLLPIVQDVDKNKSKIAKTLVKMDKSIESGLKTKEEWRIDMARDLEKARERFPIAIREAETKLGKVLLERLPSSMFKELSDEINGKNKKSKNRKKTDANGETDDVKMSEKGKSQSLSTSASSLPPNLDLDELKKVEDGLKVRVHKTRNVGGPVTTKLAASVNRKWLENDVPVAASYNEYVPQVGDIVLYYPCAHYEFLKKYPDIRCKKNRLSLRRPLWDRAIEEKKEQEKPKKKKTADDEEDEANVKPKRKKIENEKPWWTMEWMSTIQEGAGRYPILCRVEKEFSEFPYDQETQTEIRRYQYDANKAKSGGKKPKRVQETKGRQKPSRHKPQMCLVVTLRPLTNVIPLSATKMSPPPVFSCLVFPTKKTPFLIPFAFAFRSSLLFQDCDRVKIVDSEGGRRNAQVLSSNEDRSQSFDNLVQSFQDILKKYGLDISNLQNLDLLITDAYSKNTLDFELPETDFRAAVQTILYQFYTRGSNEKVQENGKNLESSQVDPISLVKEVFDLLMKSLPHWKSVKIKVDSDEKKVCPWKLELFATDKDHDQEAAVSAALAPNILISPNRICHGGQVHAIDESVRCQLESVLKYLIENDERLLPFIPQITDANTSEYSRFVPLSMCFRRILKRLKNHRLKYSRSSHKDGEGLLEDQIFGETNCCYYRSIGSLHSDISDIFQNCLIYNSPDSDIVLAAFHVTNFVKIVVDKVADNWQKDRYKKRKIEISQKRKVELAARRELLLEGTKKHSIPANQVEDYGIIFEQRLDRAWISTHQTYASKNSSNSDTSELSSQRRWLPQCGDRIVYNRMHHEKFINGHLESLKTIQRLLPSVLPPSNKKRKKDVQKQKEVGSQADSETYPYWLGTILWVRAVFPSSDVTKAVDDVTPLFAIGIKFHYKWLAKRVTVIYWKPCLSTQRDENGMGNTAEDHLRSCKFCGLKVDHSFISPAWNCSTNKILPPYPLNLLQRTGPSGILADKKEKIKLCVEEIKRRIVGNSKIDEFIPNEALTVVIDEAGIVPQRFRHIFHETEHEKVQNMEVVALESLSASSSKRLSKIAFTAPWTLNLNEVGDKSMLTRRKNTANKKDGEITIPFYETIIADTGLSLDLIYERLNNGFYRSTAAIINDLREATICAIIYTIKEKIMAKRLGRASEDTVLKTVIEACGVDISAFLSDDNSKVQSTKEKMNASSENSKDGDGASKIVNLDTEEVGKLRRTTNLKQLNCQERLIVSEISAIFRLYAIAIVSCTEMPIAELALGLEMREPFHNDESLDNDQVTAHQNLSRMLASLRPDKMKFRKPLSNSDDAPTVNVFVKVNTKEKKPIRSEICVDDTINISDNLEMVMHPDEYKTSQDLYKILGPFKKKLPLPPVKISVVCNGFNAEDVVRTKTTSNLGKYEILKSLGSGETNFEDNIVSKNEENSTVAEDDAGNEIVDDKSNAQDKTDGNDSCEAWNNSGSRGVDVKDLADIDLSEPLKFTFADYYNNTALIRALFCRSKRKQTCARCVLSKKGLFSCRVRFAHSNVDPTWIDYYRSKGGIDKILSILDPEYKPKISISEHQESVRDDDELASEQPETHETKGDDDDLKAAVDIAVEVQAAATNALELSHAFLKETREEVKKPILLSSKFMYASFTVDPDDGHFEICPKCGLGGDVICCESCPMVSHPKCVGMDVIPDEDWHCPNCTSKKRKAANAEDKLSLLEANHENLESDMDIHDQVADKLATILDELKSSRQKQSPIQIGTKILRDFEGKAFTGWVIELPSESMEFYKVRYEDDDEEDFTNEEIQPCIAAYVKKQKAVDDDDTQRKRGRPRKQSVEPIEVTSESGNVVRRRGRPRNIRESPVPSDAISPRKRRYPSGSSIENPDMPQRKRGRGRPPKVQIEEIPLKSRRRGKPPNNLDTSDLEPRGIQPKKRGRPRKNRETSDLEPLDIQPKKRGRGRPRKNRDTIDLERLKKNDEDAAKEKNMEKPSERSSGRKRGRGRARNQNSTTPAPQAVSPTSPDISDKNAPNPGHVDKSMTYYCTKENDTATKIASMIGCESWLDVAYIPENLERFPALANKKIKFRRGTLVRIAEASFANKKALRLVE